MDEEIESMVYAAIVALFVVYAIMAAEFEPLIPSENFRARILGQRVKFRQIEEV